MDFAIKHGDFPVRKLLVIPGGYITLISDYITIKSHEITIVITGPGLFKMGANEYHSSAHSWNGTTLV